MSITDSDLLAKYVELCEKYADMANVLVDARAEIQKERARNAKLVSLLEIRSKRSTYDWSGGPEYSPDDWANEGQIAMAIDALEWISALEESEKV